MFGIDVGVTSYLIPIRGVRLPYRLRRLIDGRPVREERLRHITLNKPVSDEKFTIPAIVSAQGEAGRRAVTGWTQRRRAAGPPYVLLIQVCESGFRQER
jgi:hypothetical protein